MEHGLVTTKFNEVVSPCPEGENHYDLKCPNAKEAIKNGDFKMHGSITINMVGLRARDASVLIPEKACEKEHPAVKEAVEVGAFERCWFNCVKYGKEEVKKLKHYKLIIQQYDFQVSMLECYNYFHESIDFEHG